MLQFAHPYYLFLLLSLPLWLLIYIVAQRKSARERERIGDKATIARLHPISSAPRTHAKFALLILAMATAIMMLARPQLATGDQSEMRRGIDVMLTVDVSQSMMSDDVPPTRLERSKNLLTNLLDQMPNNRIGLVAFAGEAYPQMPISTDKETLRLLIDNLHTDMISLQGTDMAAAIQLAAKSLNEPEAGKAIILITDGENHEPGAVEAARQALEAGIRTYVVGIGTPQGGQIIIDDNPLHNSDGTPVLTQLNADNCKAIAEAGGGIFLHADDSNATEDQLLGALSQLQQRESAFVDDGKKRELFPYLAALFLLLIVAELLLSARRNVSRRKP